MEILSKVRAFAREELVGAQASLDALAEAPLPIYRRFHERGLGNWWLPTATQPGHGLTESVDIVSELAYGDAGTAFTLFISILGTTMLSLYGTDELRERFLKPMRARGSFCATLGSEHAAGSELTKLATTATRSGDDVVIRGEKSFSTNTAFADFLVVIAQTSDDPGYLAVVVPRDTAGVHIRKRWELNGLRAAATYQVSLEDCRVPARYVLRGHGLRVVEIGLNASRLLIAASAIGIARRIRDLCMDYAETKPLRNAMLIHNPVFAAKLGQMEMLIEVMRNQCLAAGAELDAIMAGPAANEEFLRRRALKSVLATKLFCGQAGWQVASVGSEMFGGHGYTRENIIGKLVRDMRYVAIIEGGDDSIRDTLFTRYVIPIANRT